MKTTSAPRRIGLLSDSHGRAEITQRAVRLLIDAGAEILIHLGDVNSQEVLDALIESEDSNGELQPPVHLVFGNTDAWDRQALAGYARDLGIRVDHPVGRLELGSKTLVYQHGHRHADMERALAESVDYLCHGHTHEKRDEMVGDTRVINPGALHRAAEYTAALLDVEANTVEFLVVERDLG